MSPQPTDVELRILDQLDQLTEFMSSAVQSGDGGAFLDALDESQFVDRRLEMSRENTWALWFAKACDTKGEAA